MNGAWNNAANEGMIEKENDVAELKQEVYWDDTIMIAASASLQQQQQQQL